MQCKQRFNLKVFLYFFALSKARNNSWVIEDLKRENKGLKSSNFLHFFFFKKFFSPASRVTKSFYTRRDKNNYFILALVGTRGVAPRSSGPFMDYFILLVFVSLEISNFMSIQFFKGCVHYIFASLYCMFKRQHFWNKKKRFSFHFESSFRSWDNQILTFQMFQCHDIIKCLSIKQEMHFTE